MTSFMQELKRDYRLAFEGFKEAQERYDKAKAKNDEKQMAIEKETMHRCSEDLVHIADAMEGER